MSTQNATVSVSVRQAMGGETTETDGGFVESSAELTSLLPLISYITTDDDGDGRSPS